MKERKKEDLLDVTKVVRVRTGIDAVVGTGEVDRWVVPLRDHLTQWKTTESIKYQMIHISDEKKEKGRKKHRRKETWHKTI